MPDQTSVQTITPTTVVQQTQTSPPKPGWKTSEFAGHAAAMLLTLIFASGLLTNQTAIQIAGIAAAWLGSLGYTVNRTLLKAGAGMLLVGLLAAPQVACSASAKGKEAAAASAFLNCEAGQFPAGTLGDATALAIQVIVHEISGGGAVDANRLKADAAPLKSNLLQCAWDAAIAALTAPPAPPKPGAPAAAAMAIDRDQLRASWADVRLELGWAPPVRSGP